MKEFRFLINGKAVSGWFNADEFSVAQVIDITKTMGIYTDWQIEYRG